MMRDDNATRLDSGIVGSNGLRRPGVWVKRMMDGLSGILALLCSVIVLISVIVVIFVMLQRRWHGARSEQGYSSFVAAEVLEKQGKFKEACWKYALSLYYSPVPIPEAQSKVKFLWGKFGPFLFASPFSFDEQFILEVEGLPPDTNEHMLYALYDGVMKELEELVDVTTREGNVSQGDS